MRVILNELSNIETRFENMEYVYKYVDKLKDMGWLNDMMEGGYISPDLSTIYYYSRSPYEGQLIQFRNTPQAKEQYKNMINQLKDDFTIIE